MSKPMRNDDDGGDFVYNLPQRLEQGVSVARDLGCVAVDTHA